MVYNLTNSVSFGCDSLGNFFNVLFINSRLFLIVLFVSNKLIYLCFISLCLSLICALISALVVSLLLASCSMLFFLVFIFSIYSFTVSFFSISFFSISFFSISFFLISSLIYELNLSIDFNITLLKYFIFLPRYH